ncbi:MAG: glycosyltransferase family 39 protein, partial [Acidobacteria bacterium]|nr:glycosyltransferase family 39 protein [Acidobacteriota bacterium]
MRKEHRRPPVSASRRLVASSIAILVVLFVLRCYSTYRVFNDTKDEAVHISSGLEVWDHGRYRVDVQHPPLARLAIGLSARLAGLRYASPGDLWKAGGVDYWRTLSAARLGNLIFVPLLLSYIYLWGRRLYGPVPGLAAAALASLCPNLLAHASLATVDFGAATTSFISAYYFWRWSREPGPRNCLKTAVA